MTTVQVAINPQSVGVKVPGEERTLFGFRVTVVVWGGTTTTVHVSTVPQSLGVKVPGAGLILLGGEVTVVV